MISFSDEHLSKTSLASYFTQCIENENHTNKKVSIITLGESLYSKYCIASIQLENHFNDFFALSGYLDIQDTHRYREVRNGMTSHDTCLLIGSDSTQFDSLSEFAASGKASHRVANISCKAKIHDQHLIYNIGYTRHNTPIDILNALDGNTSLGLGAAKQDVTLIEPLVRDARIATIDLAMISNSSVGFNIFEMCSIVRYLGYANSLDTLYLYHDQMLEKEYPIEQAALLTWYFLEGRQHRQDDYPTNPSNQTYLVHSSLLDLDLEFSKSNLTGRWWMQHPENESNYIPISFSEYNSVIKNEVPSRILELISE